MNVVLRKLLHPHWYLSSVLIFSCLLVACLYRPLAQFYVLDPLPQVLPYPDNTSYSSVQTGLLIKNFGKFDVAQNTFLIDVIIWFAFDPKKVKQDAIGAFSFDQAEILYSSTPYYSSLGQKTIAWYETRIKFSTNLNYHLFPVDDHLITLVLHNKALINQHAIYKAIKNDFQYEEDIHMHGWEIVNKSVEAGYGQHVIQVDNVSHTITIPRVAFTLACSRIGIRHLMIIMLPLFVIYCIALISLLLNLETQQEKIIEIISGSLAGLIGYRFVLESMSPSVDYFMISDYIYLIFLAALFVLFLIILLHRYISHWSRSLIIIVLHSSILALWFYYFNIWLVPIN